MEYENRCTIKLNKKYNNIFTAYILGWIVGNANIYDDELFFFIKECNKDMVIKLYKLFLCIYEFNNEDIFYSMSKDNDFYLKIKNIGLINDIKILFNLTEKSENNSYKKDNLKYVDNISKEMIPYFARGLFDSAGFIYNKENEYYCGIRLFSHVFLNKLMNDLNINHQIIFNSKYNNYSFTLSDVYALDFLDTIYKPLLNANINLYLSRKYECYNELKKNKTDSSHCIKYYKTSLEAYDLYKNNSNDYGYTITLINRMNHVNNMNKNIQYYNTGIILKPMIGFYFEIACDNMSLYELGYIYYNQIVDNNTIIIKLIKYDYSKDDLILPCSLFKIIPKKIYNMDIVQMNKPFDDLFKSHDLLKKLE
jgi:hypothetical protein